MLRHPCNIRVFQASGQALEPPPLAGDSEVQGTESADEFS